MRVLMISKAMVTGVYQKKAEELARLPDVDLCLVVPPYWHEDRVGDQPLQEMFTDGYELAVQPMRFNGHHHLHYYPGLGRLMRAFRPDIVHIDEEPYNFVSCTRQPPGSPCRSKNGLFRLAESLSALSSAIQIIRALQLSSASAAIAGNRDAGLVFRRKHYRGPIAVIPQFGVDPEIYSPPSSRSVSSLVRSSDTSDESSKRKGSIF